MNISRWRNRNYRLISRRALVACRKLSWYKRLLTVWCSSFSRLRIEHRRRGCRLCWSRRLASSRWVKTRRARAWNGLLLWEELPRQIARRVELGCLPWYHGKGRWNRRAQVGCWTWMKKTPLWSSTGQPKAGSQNETTKKPRNQTSAAQTWTSMERTRRS